MKPGGGLAIQLINMYELSVIWRQFNNSKKHYSWFYTCDSIMSATRLDRFMVLNTI